MFVRKLTLTQLWLPTDSKHTFLSLFLSTTTFSFPSSPTPTLDFAFLPIQFFLLGNIWLHRPSLFRVFFKFFLDFFGSWFLDLPFPWILNSEMHEQPYLIDCVLCYLSLSSVILHVVKSDFTLCHSYSFWMVNFSLQVTQMGNYFKAWIPANNCSGIKLIPKAHTTTEHTKTRRQHWM